MPPFQAYLCLLLNLFLFLGSSALPVATASRCPAVPASGLLQLASDCIWASTGATGALNVVSITGERDDPAESGVVTVSRPSTGALEQPQENSSSAASGVSLRLERLVLVGFAHAGPGASEPFLWPHGCTQQAGKELKLIDVRLVTADLAVFRSWLQVIASSSDASHWTDNSTFIHVHHWSDSATTLQSVGLLLQPTDGSSGIPGNTQTLTGNYVTAATNRTLVPVLLQSAAVVTPQPLVVYITTNVTLGANPQLPANGLAINRPVVFVGLQSLLTSMDFQMVVNQLNATGSAYSDVTLVSLVLENLAPRDSDSSALAAPLSITVSNNVWPVFYNRTAQNQVRLNFVNVTMVIPQESEMAYVTYMFTMYTSQSPCLRQQSSLWSDVMHVSVLQYEAGPGSEAMTAHRVKSLYHIWTDVILTTVPQVAKPLPLPPRSVAISTTTKVSALVQAVHDAQELRAAGEYPLTPDRQHVLLLLSNISVPEPGSNSSRPMQLQSAMTWMGTSPTDPPEEGSATNTYVGFGYTPSIIKVVSPASETPLQLQQLVLWQLPQAPNASAAVVRAGTHTPQEIWTLLLWCIVRPTGGPPVQLRDVHLLLPEPEFQYLLAAAARASDFVVVLDGSDPASPTLTFQDVSCTGSPCSSIHVGSLQGPRIEGSDITLLLDPAAATAVPGYVWPAQSVPPGRSVDSGMAPWAVPVVAACVSGVAVVAAAVGFVAWRGRQRSANSKLAPDLLKDVEQGSSSTELPYPSVIPYRSEDWQLLAATGSKGMASCIEEGTNQGLVIASGAGSRATVDSAPDLEAQSRSRDNAAGIVAAKRAAPVETIEQPMCEGRSGIAQPSDAPVSAPATSALSGRQRMRAAISSTTRLLMERRMEVTLPVAPVAGTGSGSSGDTSKVPGRQSQMGQQELQPSSAAELSAAAADRSSSQLQLQSILGQGSFGCVYQATWHGKVVAVKIMQLPSSAVFCLPGDSTTTACGDREQDILSDSISPHVRQQQKRMQRKQQNSPSHMALMEAVLSSHMSHPNVVQVYTYMVNPLMSNSESGDDQDYSCSPAPVKASVTGNISGWEMKIVMEYCDQGSLRESLDRGLLCKQGRYLAHSAALQLAHDVASAMLHLHSEGVVHGDLKAGNIMLTHSGGTGPRVLSTLRGRPLQAKVADFGLSMSLGPTDTHASLCSRGTPTHMSPELIISGHVSRASDVYAFGILLYEVITGQRAYAGIPIPLLPHEVARQGLRPKWPADLPPHYKQWMPLAEACWTSKPADRPSFEDIMRRLDGLAAGCQDSVAEVQHPPLLPSPNQICVGNCSNGQTPGSERTAACPASQQQGQQASEHHQANNLLQVQRACAVDSRQRAVKAATPPELPLLPSVDQEQPQDQQGAGGEGDCPELVIRASAATANKGHNLSWSQVDCGVSNIPAPR